MFYSRNVKDISETIPIISGDHASYVGKKCVRNLGTVVSRKKQDDPSSGSLARVLGLADLSLLGVGSTLGVGVYVLAGAVAKSDAGPAVTLSFFVAAFASALAGVCYAEFAARVPKAGSAYVYSYVTVGELAAFVIGWNLVLEYIIGTASVAKAFSTYLDTMMNYTMSRALTDAFPIHKDFMSPFPDFLAFGIIIVLTALLAWGVRESALMNNVFTGLNLLTVVIVIGAGLFKVDAKNWSIPKENIPEGVKGGNGGFMPFGLSGVMAGAAKCFFGFIGFDCVATTGEEAKNPQRDIPLAIVISLLVIFLSYFGISTVLTMMWPYYDQNADAPLVVTFKNVGLDTVSVIVSAGAVFALCTSLLGAAFPLPRVLWAMANDGLLPSVFGYVSEYTQTPLVSTVFAGVFAAPDGDNIIVERPCAVIKQFCLLGSMFPMPRMLYAMAGDGLLFRSLASVHPVTKTPLFATVTSGFFSGVMGALFKLDQLIDMMSIGTLLAYTIVALCVLILRYRDPKPALYEPASLVKEKPTLGQSFGQVINYNRQATPDKSSTKIAEVSIGLFTAFTIISTFWLAAFENELGSDEFWRKGVLIFLLILTCLPALVIFLQPQVVPNIFFKVPMIPFLPCVSIFINVYLMMKLNVDTWIRFLIWLFIGGLIYLFYSIPNSVEGKRLKTLKEDKSKHLAMR